MTRRLPETASQADTLEDGRLFAASAARNQAALTHVVARHAPQTGRALEIASGTGQHIVSFAEACPRLIWVPTDVDPKRLASIQTYVAEAQLPNLSPPVALNALQSGWSQTTGAVDLIVLANLLHLITANDAKQIVSEIAQALAPSGRAVIYGPFLRDGQTTSEGDTRFHASLRQADPLIGYKDIRDMLDWASEAGAPVTEQIEMPANNIAFILSKPE